MTEKKKEILNKAYKEFFNIMLYNHDHERLKDCVVEDVMGYGTTLDERIFNLTGLQEIVIRQKEQGKDIELSFDITPIHRNIPANEDIAVYVDEIKVRMQLSEGKNEFTVRISTVFEYKNGTWKVIHWHGSKPEHDAEGTDTWHKEEWKKRNEELQKLVDEKTADLELKNRELIIEAALEHIRARAMSMVSSSELIEVANVMRHQMGRLGQPELETTAVHLYDDDSDNFDTWYAFRSGKVSEVKILTGIATFRKDAAELVREMITNYNSHENEYTLEASGKRMMEFFQVLSKAAPEITKYLGAEKPEKVYYHFTDFSGGSLVTVSYQKPIIGVQDLQKKMAGVFDLAYRRFLDLKKAEAQAREAQIEMALERVRSKTMAMHNSHDVGITVVTLFDEVLKLGLDKSIRCGIGILEGNEGMETWSATSHPNGEVDLKMGMLDMTIHPMLIGLKKAWKSGETGYSYQYIGDDVTRYYNALNNEPEYPFFVELDTLPEKEFHNSFFFSEGILFAFALNPISEEAASVLDRFAHVFGQTYRRYLDLQKAEEQAHEAQIEVALEKVRAKSMAMHKSEQLPETAKVLFEQFQSLGKIPDRIGIVIFKEEVNEFELWGTDQIGSQLNHSFKGSLEEATIMAKMHKAWKEGKDSIVIDLTGQDLIDWMKYNRDDVKLPIDDTQIKSRRVQQAAFFSQGMILFTSNEPIGDETISLLVRFAKVFDQVYTRFLDLQKAEEQAREAQIEAGLERVRSRTLTMQKSEELPETAAVVFKQLIDLGIASNRLFIGIIKNKIGTIDFWLIDNEGTRVSEQFTGNSNRNASINKMYDGWKKKKKSITIDIKGKELENYFQYMGIELNVPFKRGLSQKRRVQNISYFSHGFIGIASPDEQPEETTVLLERFAAVFNLTYARFHDLKVAEAQAREALIEGALERVRARALAMQEPEELKEVAQVLRHEMGLLGVEELETSSIYINDENAHKAEYWYALKDVRKVQKKLVSDHFELDLNDTWVGKEMLKFYNSENKKISIVMTGQARIEWIRYCEEKSVPFRGYYGEVIPDRTYHLYKFSHGAIGAATPGDFSTENWGLLKRAASVFSLAYSRFKDLTQARYDLQQLKEEKKRAEEALKDLKSTQVQLIHAEKMASLGELTAGIAHEIQNPLNFVNNFSEVNGELIKELKEEIEKGDKEEAMAIANDIAGNEEKINHHGKRADGIVKGMLQHSRSGSNEKEMTDINVLADEYLRLAYHGLRAKDKSFNADFKADLDKDLPKTNVIPQDIGRVLLNLINNAFYAVSVASAKETAVSEEAPAKTDGYKPIVIISTKKLKDKVEIKVKDNGNGIPDNIIEKIFQPFFTTKPTGDGTGLGLSMSYDIVTKGHGGVLTVETNQGEGTTFIVQLPIKIHT